jgi:hypothetical protein
VNQPDEKGLDLNEEGLDPFTATGTRDVIDPETGVLATGGGPMTTGEGISASTIGVGSNEGEQEYKSGDFKGSTPREGAYEHGVDGEVSAKPE